MTGGQHKADPRGAITRIPVEYGTHTAAEKRPVKGASVNPPRQLERLDRKQAARRQEVRRPPAKANHALGQAPAQGVSTSPVQPQRPQRGCYSGRIRRAAIDRKSV